MGGKTSFNSEQTKAVVEILKNIDSFKRRVPGTDVIEAPSKRILDWELIYGKYDCLRQFKTKQILKKIGCLEDIERSKVSSNYRQPWTNDELTKLFVLVAKHSKVFPNGESRINFKKVSKEFGNTRSKSQLVGQYGNLTRKVSITNRKDFTQEENLKLAQLYSKYNGKWNDIEKEFNSGVDKENQRTSEQLRNHHNCLYFAKTKKGAWSKEEKERLWAIVSKHTFNGITHMPAVYESFGTTRSPIQIKQQCQLTKFNDEEEVLLVELVNKHNASHLAMGSPEWSSIFKEFNAVQKSHLKRDEKLIYRLYKKSIVNRLPISNEQKSFIKDQYAKGMEADEVHGLMQTKFGSDLELIKVVNICSRIYWNIDSDGEDEDYANYQDNDSEEDNLSDESGEDLKLGFIGNDQNFNIHSSHSDSDNNGNHHYNDSKEESQQDIYDERDNEQEYEIIHERERDRFHPYQKQQPYQYHQSPQQYNNNNNYHHQLSPQSHQRQSPFQFQRQDYKFQQQSPQIQHQFISTTTTTTTTNNSNFTYISDSGSSYNTIETPKRDNQIRVIDLLNDDDKKRKSPDSNIEIINYWKKLKQVN